METTATSKGQIVIPAKVRRQLGIRKGTRIAVHVDEREQTIVLKPITREFIESLRGIDRGRTLVEDLVSERTRDKDREERPMKPRAKRPSKGR
jgi:AbrB family looped-hinge helix DNA binding protein